jgi:hypothetical protein
LIADIGDLDMFGHLIAIGVDLASLEGQGWTAEQRAIRAGNPELAEVLSTSRIEQQKAIVVVEAPGNYANSTLNGSEGILLRQDKENNIAEVLLTTGENAGRRWQFDPQHLKPLTQSQVVSEEITEWTQFKDVLGAIEHASSIEDLKEISDKLDAAVWRDKNPLRLSDEETHQIGQAFHGKYDVISAPVQEEDAIRPAMVEQSAQEEPAKAEEQPAQQETTVDAIKPINKALFELATAAAKRPKKLLGGKFIGDDQGNYRRLGDEKVCLVDEIQRIRFIDKQMDTFEAAVELAKAKGWNAIEVTGSDRFRAEAWYVARKAGLEVVGHEPSAKDLARLGEGISTDGPSEIEKSRKAAEVAALQKVGAIQGVDAAAGRYAGPMVLQNDHHVVQDIGRGMSVILELGKFPPMALRDFASGQSLKIQYQAGSGRVEAGNQDLGHSR